MRPSTLVVLAAGVTLAAISLVNCTRARANDFVWHKPPGSTIDVAEILREAEEKIVRYCALLKPGERMADRRCYEPSPAGRSESDALRELDARLRQLESDVDKLSKQ